MYDRRKILEDLMSDEELITVDSVEEKDGYFDYTLSVRSDLDELLTELFGTEDYGDKLTKAFNDFLGELRDRTEEINTEVK